MRGLLVSCLLVGAGCGSGHECVEGDPCSRDAAGPPSDAGTGDAGSAGDAGNGADAGPAEDGGGTADAAPGDDGGGGDAGGTDGGGADAGGSSDAGPPSDGGTCNPSAVSFPMGGSLAPGTLCDDVFVCVADAAEAARVRAASARFVCSSMPKGACRGWTCVYRDPGGPSVLDAAEVAEICAVTLLSPTPTIVCRVYL